MRVLIVNTSEKTGGAAVAANRLLDALNNNGVKAKMLVRDKETSDITVIGLGNNLRRQLAFLWERWCIYTHLHFRRTNLFQIDIANAGNDITKLREFKEADVVHLHWINQGMLSLKGIRKILESGKPVVWTMHDFWPATSLCHYPRNCHAYMTRGCHNCQYLPQGGSANDLSVKTWKRKETIWKAHNIIFVACSRWLALAVKSSALLSGKEVVNIPNTIDTRLFKPIDINEARKRLSLPLDKKIILFVSQKITDSRKGIDYLISACEMMVKEHPQIKDTHEIVILGGHSEEYSSRFQLKVHSLGYVNESQKIVDVYNAADVFVLPSLEDNLPNTIMEAMACGTPCVGFNVGGIPEMIEHRKNGYVALSRSAEDLAKGIFWVTEEAKYEELKINAVHKVAVSYSQQSVAMKYIEIYNQAIAYRHYRL